MPGSTKLRVLCDLVDVVRAEFTERAHECPKRLVLNFRTALAEVQYLNIGPGFILMRPNLYG
jgi:hypothetical protein